MKTTCRIAILLMLIGSGLTIAQYALDWYETGHFRFTLALEIVAFGVLTYAWLNRHQQPSVRSMLLGDLLVLPILALTAGMFFTFAGFVHNGGFAVFDGAVGLYCAGGAVIVARRIMNRMLAGVENPSFRAAEQTMLDDIGELVQGMQTERALRTAA
jgi:hypothetical protein